MIASPIPAGPTGVQRKLSMHKVVTMKTGSIQNANFPKDKEGRTYHLGTKFGELANRIVTVGDSHRARLLAGMLDNPEKNFHRTSSRGFHVFTGTKGGVPVSIIATGMGIPMVDMMVREARACIKGPMLMCRLGTCGTPSQAVPVGAISVATGSVMVTSNYNGFYDSVDEKKSEASEKTKYHVSVPIPACKELVDHLYSKLKSSLKSHTVVRGLNATADSFYSSQGRQDAEFKDDNEALIDDLLETHPGMTSLEMESGHLFHLAKQSAGSFRAAACTIVLAQRKTNAFLSNPDIKKMEKLAGAVVIDVVASFQMD